MAEPRSVEAGGPAVVRSVNPATGEVVAEVPAATQAEVHRAVEEARRAWPGWADLGPEGRARALREVHDRVYREADRLVTTISAETGKPPAEALAHDVVPAMLTLRYLGWIAPRALRTERVAPLAGPLFGVSARVEWRPYGVVGGITPWNYPLLLPVMALTPALLAGNAVVLKPSELTPGVGELIREVLRPLPPGVAGVVQGDGSVGAAVVAAPCDKVCFIGSAETGRRVAEAAARTLTPVVLELGGQDAAVVCGDADLDVASSGVLWGAFFNAGQTCCSIERVYVVEEVAEEFERLLVAKAARLRSGPDGGAGDLGPVANREGLARVRAHVEDAVRRGARVLAGGPWGGDSPWYPPTVLEGRTPDMRYFVEETFGPVLPIVRVRDEEEAVLRANREGTNLTASVWTRDRAKGRRIAARLRAGAVAINDHAIAAGTPWGAWGGVGRSGYGRLCGVVGIREFAVPVQVARNLLPGVKRPWWYPYDDAVAELFRGLAGVLAAPGVWERVRALAGAVGAAGRALRGRL